MLFLNFLMNRRESRSLRSKCPKIDGIEGKLVRSKKYRSVFKENEAQISRSCFSVYVFDSLASSLLVSLEFEE